MRVLITGITGFVGRYLARALVDLGCEVYGLYRRRASGRKPEIPGVSLIEGDLTDLTSILFALDESSPDVIFHLGAQTYVPRSFIDPLETFRANCLGTQNLLEAVRLKDLDPVIVFAGSSEEYGLQIVSESQYERLLRKYGVIYPPPERIPEIPISEENPLRPMSPYAVSKVYGDFLMRNYHVSYGLKTVVSRAFNHEGAGRGHQFVTSKIVRQLVMFKQGKIDHIEIGNVSAFRDWSHVKDIVKGYLLLAEKGRYGDVYVQGSMRTNSVLTYILLTAEELGYDVKAIKTMRGDKEVKNPTELDDSEVFGVRFVKTKVDTMMLNEELHFDLRDKGIYIITNRGNIPVVFDPKSFRPSDVPILLSDTRKIGRLGFKVEHSLRSIIRDQINYYLNPENQFIS